MAKLQEMTQEQITEVLEAAVAKQVPLTVTLKRDNGWISCHTRLLCAGDPHMLLDELQVHDSQEVPRIAPAEKIGMSFKLKHHKHIFTVTAVGPEKFAGGREDLDEAFAVCWPTRMHRLQRRAYLRADLPPGRVVRASFWTGGRDNEPTQPGPERPVWSGRLGNLSAGGFQVEMDHREVWDLETGETVGVRLAFEAGSESIYADAQFRHLDRFEDHILLGFQFIGLAQDRKGREALQYISSKVAEYHRRTETLARRT